MFETALVDGTLLVHVSARGPTANSNAVDEAASKTDAEGDSDSEASTKASDEADERWITFSHDDPSLFLAEADIRTAADE